MDQSTTMETTYARQSSTSEEETQMEIKQTTTKKPETKERHPPSRQKVDKQHKNGENRNRRQRQESGSQDRQPQPEESTMEDSSLTSVDTLLSDLSLESDQLYRLLGAQGVRKLSSKLVKLQNKIDKQKEHHRKHDEHGRKHGAPKMASTPAQIDQDTTIQKVVDTIKGSKSNGHVLSSAGHMLSPVAERSQETIEMSSQITLESAVSDQEPAVKQTTEKPAKHQRRHILTERQLKKLERRRKHKHVNYRDDFYISYGSETPQTDSLSEGSLPCTCRPRRTKSLQDMAARGRSKAAVTIEPKSHAIRRSTYRAKSSPKASRLPSRIPVHSGDDTEMGDTGLPPQAAKKAQKGTAFTITFKSDKRKGKDNKQHEAEESEENGKRQRRLLQYRQRGTADGEG